MFNVRIAIATRLQIIQVRKKIVLLLGHVQLHGVNKYL